MYCKIGQKFQLHGHITWLRFPLTKKVALKELQTAVTKRDSTVAQEWMAFNLKAQKDEI